MVKVGLEKDSSSTIFTIDKDFILTCMLGSVEKDENWSLPEAGLSSHVLL